MHCALASMRRQMAHLSMRNHHYTRSLRQTYTGILFKRRLVSWDYRTGYGSSAKYNDPQSSPTLRKYVVANS